MFNAWREAIDVGRKAGIPVEISHIKLAVKPMWGKTAEGLKILEDAKREGIRVMADWYPYTYWHSSIYVLITDRNLENRKAWEEGLEDNGGPQNVLVTDYRPDPSLNGKTIAEIAKRWNKDAVTTIIDMIHAAGPGIGIIGTSMDEPDLPKFLAHPQVLIGSDGSLGGSHPRSYNAFPRVLARYVRERHVDLAARGHRQDDGPHGRAAWPRGPRRHRPGQEGRPRRLRPGDDRRSRHAAEPRRSQPSASPT